MKTGTKILLGATGLIIYLIAKSKGEYIPIQIPIPRLMMITWTQFTQADMDLYKRNHIDTIYRIINATEWSNIESTEGTYDLSKLRNSLQLAKNAGLNVIPTIGIHIPPDWFTTRYPDSVMKCNDGTIPKPTYPISNAWITELYKKKYIQNQSVPEYDKMENFISKVIDELKTWDNVIGVELGSWRQFAGRMYTGDISSINDAVLLAGFDRYYQDRWNPSPYFNTPTTVLEYNNLSNTNKLYWQDWAEDINGETANILLNFIYSKFNTTPNPKKPLFVIRKHIWGDNSPYVLKRIDFLQLNERQNRKFLEYVKDFSTVTGWKQIIFNNDSYYGGPEQLSKDLIKPECYIYLGEGCNCTPDLRDVNNINITPPDTFVFVPIPGGHGEHIENPDEQEIINLMLNLKRELCSDYI